MGKCVNHPDRETSYLCRKHNIYLCEECLQCRDPELYCKFRPSCPISFMSKKPLDAEEIAQSAETLATGKSPAEADNTADITFAPDDVRVNVPLGSTLLDAARAADVYINASCNGRGSCGKCKLIIESGEVDAQKTAHLSESEVEKGYVLACQTKVQGDVTVKVPEETREKALKAAGMGEEVTRKLQGLVTEIAPLTDYYDIQLEPPTLDDAVSDLDRLFRGLKKSGCDTDRLNVGLGVMRQLATAMREDNWHISVAVLHKKCSSEIVRVTPHEEAVQSSLGVAIDVGTTSVVVYIVDMEDGTVLSAASGHNRQAACGDDVINRIVCAEKNGVKKLSAMALATINNLIREGLEPLEADPGHIENMVISGNTTMVHLLLGIEPRYIRREPYIPTVSEFPVMTAGNVGIKASAQAGLFVVPGPASYVGGDIVSGMIYTGFHREAPLTLFIDVGTNGEIVLGNRDFLMAASCSAGPAFEGGGIRWGMRAEEGAVETITIAPDTLEPDYATLGEVAPRGICGTGMIELLGELFVKKIIDPNGKFKKDLNHSRIITFHEEPAYVIEFAENTAMEEDLIFTESDIRSLMLSKAAVYAGFSVLLEEVGLTFQEIEQVYITGGFGQFLDVDKAVTIGLLPDIERSKFQYLGNSSISGAYMMLLSRDYRAEALKVCNSMTYIDFSSNAGFMDEFTSAQFLPHTNGAAFPSVSVFSA